MRAVLVVSLLTLLVGGACITTGIVCQTGTEACGTGCVDPQNDKRNCGGCGRSCGNNQECQAGSCQCQAGTTLCNGECVVTSTDARYCGSCTNACGTGQVCELGSCKATCTLGSTVLCGSSCVDPNSDVGNCGGCGVTCAAGQSCRAGTCTYDVVAACFSTGQVIGLSASTLSKGTLATLGSAPQGLAAMQGRLLSVDGFDRRLYQGVISRTGIAQAANASVIGDAPSQVLVDGTTAYVINASTGTLQVLTTAADAGQLTLDGGAAGGLALGTAGELNFGMNSFPEGVAKLGSTVWVPLNGGAGSSADAGQVVVKVSVADPANPAELGRVDLRGLDLHPFDGGSPVARPWAVTVRNGAVYVVLNNLNPSTYAPEGPGLLARIDPTSSAVTPVALFGRSCLNPQWAAPVGGKLAVSCAGAAQYDSSYNVVSVAGAGVGLLDDGDQPLAFWSAACAADAGTLADGGLACPPMTPGRFAVKGQRLLVGDQNTGRIVVLDVSDAGLAEVRGLSAPVTTCPARNVADLLTLP